MMNKAMRGLMLVLFVGSAYGMELTKTLKLNDVKKLLYEDNTLRLLPLPHEVRRTIYPCLRLLLKAYAQ